MEAAIFKFLDFLLNGYLIRRKKIKETELSFNSMRNEIVHTSIINEIPVALSKLRHFIIESDLLSRSDIRKFYEKWLVNPIVECAIPVANAYSADEVASLKSELLDIKLNLVNK